MGRIAVLKGGSSLERQVSLRSAARGQDALERLSHDLVPVDVGGDLVERLRAEAPDAAFIALHGVGGEDGTVQELLEILGIPYTGSGVLACMRSMDKVLAKHLLLAAGIPTPEFFAFNETAFQGLGAAAALPAIEERLDFPIVGKPAGQGSGAGIHFPATLRHRARRSASTSRAPPPIFRARSWPRSPTTRGCCSSATSAGATWACRCSRGRRCRWWRRCRGKRTSTTSNRDTRSGGRRSCARPSCRSRSRRAPRRWRWPPTTWSAATA